MKKGHLSALVTAALTVAIFAGCQPSVAPKGGDKAAKKENDDGHDHGPGPHGGTIIEFAKWHGEFLVDPKTQEATVYLLGADAKTAVAVKADKLLLSIKDPVFQVDLKAAPMAGETNGMSSRFVGKHENFGKEQAFAGIVSVVIEGKQHLSDDFKEKAKAPPKEKK